ncbi:DUF2130 domain-containing protein [Segatella sinensis]|uniref:DUF2130 domain-containing protein n=1 Tax=Segatella sinensis TaxID=3085167 RepID=A0ABV1FXW3_9BACT
MKELKCPKCGNVFKVDEADYAAIVGQVKNAEFNQEVERRMKELEKQQKAEQKAETLKAEQNYQKLLSEKELNLTQKDAEIAKLQSQLEGIEKTNQLSLAKEIAKKDKEIAALQTQLSSNESKLKVAILEEQNKSKDFLQKKEQEIQKLKGDMELAQKEAIIKEKNLKEDFQSRLKLKQEEVDHYKELKAHMSTKMIGESLEVHCSTEFNRVRSMMYPCAYFEKDNDASGGSKGDFIFRDTADGVEYISIMFEMKNEMETTATKHKNEDFFAKLDKDRKEKGCEYAVLVSLLEPDSELYNEGIVDVSYKYPKMYVIRPQFFMPLISLLTQASKKSIEYQKELILARQQSVDVTNFENKVNAFRDKFAGHYQKASEKFNKAIEEIDKTIKSLQKMKDNLLSSENYLRLANNDTEDLSIKKLIRGNPTMKEKFEEARRMDEASTHLG